MKKPDLNQEAKAAASQMLAAVMKSPTYTGWLVSVFSASGDTVYLTQTTHGFLSHNFDLVVGQFVAARGRVHQGLGFCGDMFGEFGFGGFDGYPLANTETPDIPDAKVAESCKEAWRRQRWLVAVWPQEPDTMLQPKSVAYRFSLDDLGKAVDQLNKLIREMKEETRPPEMKQLPDLPGPPLPCPPGISILREDQTRIPPEHPLHPVNPSDKRITDGR